MQVCHIEAIISLPKFAFAPYTKEKTYAIFLQKKHERVYNALIDEKIGKKNLPTGKMQSTPIWMYIIDNDGFANSDKRFPTRLRDANQCWFHDEVSGYSDNDGIEQKSILVQRWKSYDDNLSNGTEWRNEKGQIIKQRKGGFIQLATIKNDSYLTLLPEKYLRPFEQHYVNEEEFSEELDNIENHIKNYQPKRKYIKKKHIIIKQKI